MGFMIHLPCATRLNADAIMVIIDRLTKRAHILATQTTATAADTAKLFCAFYQRLHGLPVSILSDLDSKFTSKLLTEIMKTQGTRLRLSSAFKPSTDSQAEVTNKFIIEYLRHFINSHHSN